METRPYAGRGRGESNRRCAEGGVGLEPGVEVMCGAGGEVDGVVVGYQVDVAAGYAEEEVAYGAADEVEGGACCVGGGDDAGDGATRCAGERRQPFIDKFWVSRHRPPYCNLLS